MFSGKEPKKTIQALSNISFTAREGEIISIKVITNEKIISLINLNIGMQSRLTMKDNIFLVSSFFGLSQKNIKQRFNLIVEFSELDNFINTKIYQFSDGMKQRLAFSIAIHCNPEILLLDEVFEVGDKNSGKKAQRR